jgi:phosphoribosylamine--glycine ligase
LVKIYWAKYIGQNISGKKDEALMNILLIGSGGREHALAWAISDSPLCDRLVITPGNPGAAAFGKLANVAADDIDGLVTLAKTEAADIVVIGPEVPLVEGLSDRLEAEGIKAFGPSAAAAQLEGSKRFGR